MCLYCRLFKLWVDVANSLLINPSMVKQPTPSSQVVRMTLSSFNLGCVGVVQTRTMLTYQLSYRRESSAVTAQMASDLTFSVVPYINVSLFSLFLFF